MPQKLHEKKMLKEEEQPVEQDEPPPLEVDQLHSQPSLTSLEIHLTI